MLALLLLACHSTTPGGDTDTDGATDTASDTASSAGPTYYADVLPIMAQTCTRCHTAGGVATSFEDPQTVVALASAIKEYTQAGIMPPPAPDPECRAYQDDERFTLTDEARATLAGWADAGAPLGDVADTPAELPDDSVRDIGPLDLTLVPPVAYAPDFSGDHNDYRCFLMDVGNAQTAYVTAAQALVDNDPIVHHVVLFLPGNPITTEDGSDPHDGFACGGLGEGDWTPLTAWGPGANPLEFPAGSGLEVPPNAQVVLQMHYFDGSPGSEPETDQTGYGLNVADSVDHVIVNFAAGPTSFTIPAGDESYKASERYGWRSGDATVVAVWPHMHLLGVGFEETIKHDDGTEDCLLRQDAWSEEDQINAVFDEPVRLGDGDVIKVSCTWDNSATNPNQYNDPPESVKFGEETTDEMCFGFSYVAF